MCCGTAQNSYKTLAGLRIVLADGTCSTRATRPAARLCAAHKPDELVQGLAELGRSVREDESAGRAHPPQVPAEEHHRLRPECAGGLHRPDRHAGPPDDRLRRHAGLHQRGHLHTVEEHAHKASALDPLRPPGNRVQRRDPAQAQPGGAVELLDRASLRAVQAKPGMPAGLRRTARRRRGAAGRGARGHGRGAAVKIDAIAEVLQGTPLAAPLRFTTDAAESAALWNVRKGIFPAVGAVRRTGTTVIIEDVAFPVERLAEAVQDLQRLLRRVRLPRGHRLRPRAGRQPALRLHAGLRPTRPRSTATAASWTWCANWW
jgi:D-lactate dehydrogenase